MALARVAGYCVMWAVWALPGIAFATEAVDELFDRPVDVGVLCGTATTKRHCLSTSPARVAHVDSNGVVTVETDSGEVAVDPAGESVPKSGSRVEIEYWDRDLVSLFDPVTGRRYRTTDWDQGWAADGGGVIAMLVWSLLWLGIPSAIGLSWLWKRFAGGSAGDPQRQDVDVGVPGG